MTNKQQRDMEARREWRASRRITKARRAVKAAKARPPSPRKQPDPKRPAFREYSPVKSFRNRPIYKAGELYRAAPCSECGRMVPDFAPRETTFAPLCTACSPPPRVVNEWPEHIGLAPDQQSEFDDGQENGR